ncbi:hypothetical protein JCM10296v2_003148 [Rhodotorula toruloides]
MPLRTVKAACDYFVHDEPTKTILGTVALANAALRKAEQQLEYVKETCSFDSQAVKKATQAEEHARRDFEGFERIVAAYKKHNAAGGDCPSDIKELLRRNQLEALTVEEYDKMDRWVARWRSADEDEETKR